MHFLWSKPTYIILYDDLWFSSHHRWVFFFFFFTYTFCTVFETLFGFVWNDWYSNVWCKQQVLELSKKRKEVIFKYEWCLGDEIKIFYEYYISELSFRITTKSMHLHDFFYSNVVYKYTEQKRFWEWYCRLYWYVGFWFEFDVKKVYGGEMKGISFVVLKVKVLSFQQL